eukprot:gnl/TRDRNA2_/TRDRNA2_169980_c1_seq4.p1 gnl/TRDRNA2_/TRDRNA2_169980_c1~~gnl/TRDRNA2_/TRDRNA2_169980_c1_seq4.p1  ORF type:complete len:132 (+),score=10.35 gnl/TRDRNA2_/TRDRNA2_169980_c1_seq4:317-712(+)
MSTGSAGPAVPIFLALGRCSRTISSFPSATRRHSSPSAEFVPAPSFVEVVVDDLGQAGEVLVAAEVNALQILPAELLLGVRSRHVALPLAQLCMVHMLPTFASNPRFHHECVALASRFRAPLVERIHSSDE